MSRLVHPKHPPYKAWSGYAREDAIMVLRRFYITENVNGNAAHHTLVHNIVISNQPTMIPAPVPKSKANRVLKTEILPEQKPSASG